MGIVKISTLSKEDKVIVSGEYNTVVVEDILNDIESYIQQESTDQVSTLMTL